jgi:hypothetical protein
VVADNVCIEGKTNITIKVGDNYIAIDSSGLKICAAKVVVESSSGTLDIKSAAAATFKAGATLDVEGTAPVTIKGAKVAIN